MSFEHKGEREGYGYSLKGTDTMTYNRFCYKRESLNSIMGKEKVYEIPSKPHVLGVMDIEQQLLYSIK